MLFPITLKISGYIQADSIQEAKKKMETALVDDLLLTEPSEDWFKIEPVQILDTQLPSLPNNS